MREQPVEVRPSEAEHIAFAYRMATEGDASAALVQAVEDALADLTETERRSLRRDRLVSTGYVRAKLTAP